MCNFIQIIIHRVMRIILIYVKFLVREKEII